MRGRTGPRQRHHKREKRHDPPEFPAHRRRRVHHRRHCRPACRRARAMDEGTGEQLVRQAAVADRLQLQPRLGGQRARDVARTHFRSGDDRQGTRLGVQHRHEHDARLPAQPALGKRPRRPQKADERISGHRRQAQDQDHVRAVRQRVGSEPGLWPAEPADPRRPQFALGAGAGRAAAEGRKPISQARRLCERHRRHLCRRQAHHRLGRVERAEQQGRRQLRAHPRQE